MFQFVSNVSKNTILVKVNVSQLREDANIMMKESAYVSLLLPKSIINVLFLDVRTMIGKPVWIVLLLSLIINNINSASSITVKNTTGKDAEYVTRDGYLAMEYASKAMSTACHIIKTVSVRLVRVASSFLLLAVSEISLIVRNTPQTTSHVPNAKTDFSLF